MYFDEPWTIECPQCAAEAKITRGLNETFSSHSNYIHFCVDTQGRYIDPDTLEERKVLHCSGCSYLWDFHDPRDDWYDLLLLEGDDLNDVAFPSPRSKEWTADQKQMREGEGLVLLAEELRYKQITSEHCHSLSAIDFEFQCAEVFRARGLGVQTTPRSNDGNIDVLLSKDGARGAAQCKAWARPVGVKAIREFIGTIYAEDLKFGYFISKSGFTSSANTLLRRTKAIEGWDLSKLIEYSLKITQLGDELCLMAANSLREGLTLHSLTENNFADAR